LRRSQKRTAEPEATSRRAGSVVCCESSDATCKWMASLTRQTSFVKTGSRANGRADSPVAARRAGNTSETRGCRKRRVGRKLIAVLSARNNNNDTHLRDGAHYDSCRRKPMSPDAHRGASAREPDRRRFVVVGRRLSSQSAKQVRKQADVLGCCTDGRTGADS